jgi:hypothetical protein
LERWWDEVSGGTPETTRETRADPLGVWFCFFDFFIPARFIFSFFAD